MAAEDYLPWDFYDEEDDDPRGSNAKCRHCGSTSVYWVKDANDKWVLYGTNSRRHVCKTRIDHSDAFDTIDDPPF